MDFTLSDEQRLLKDSVDRLMADRYAFDQRKNHFKEPGGWSTALWSQYADLALNGSPVYRVSPRPVPKGMKPPAPPGPRDTPP